MPSISRPTSDDRFDAQGVHSFDYMNTPSEAEGGPDDLWYYGLLE